MEFRLVTEEVSALEEHARVPIAFQVNSILDVVQMDNGLGGVVFIERRVDPPYVKDYDTTPGSIPPMRWAETWDLSQWGIIAAFDGDARIGGAVIAYDTPGVHMLEGRKDQAVLWDLRVHPDYRRRGVGSQLFEAVVAWAAKRGCRWLKIETQNINVPACRFYVKRGCTLGIVHRFAYSTLPDETALVWYKDLASLADRRKG